MQESERREAERREAERRDSERRQAERRAGAEWKQVATELRDRADRLRRSILEKDVLRDTLPLRAQTVARRAAAPEAQAREQRFLDASPAYATALADETSFADCVRRITLDGLAWWVPLARPDDAVRV